MSYYPSLDCKLWDMYRTPPGVSCFYTRIGCDDAHVYYEDDLNQGVSLIYFDLKRTHNIHVSYVKTGHINIQADHDHIHIDMRRKILSTLGEEYSLKQDELTSLTKWVWDLVHRFNLNCRY